MRHLRLLAALLVLLLGAAACGDDDPSPDANSATVGEDDAGDATYPVTIAHRHGETVLEARPERIVTLNVQWTDAVLAMGVEPVAYGLDVASQETDPYPWQAEAVAEVERLDFNGSLPYEKIAALRPDLILVTWAAEDRAVYDTLAAIAPTIGLLGDLQVDPWEDMVGVLGEALDDEDRADAVLADVEAQVEALADELPGLAGKTYAMANYVPGDSIYVVVDPEDGASRLLYQLGLEIDPELLALDEDAVGRIQLSLEQAGLLDADLLLVLTNGADPAELVGWDQLPAVEGDTVLDFEFADVVGLNTPTPLSIPYVVELLRPTLERLATG